MRLFPARALLIGRSDRTGMYVAGNRPLVVFVSARDGAVVDPADLKALGYRLLCLDRTLRGAYYVRPLPLWVLLKATHTARHAFWHTVWWLYGRGIFHLASEEGTDFRWRDVRPGPERGVPLTQAEIEQEMTRILAEVEERYSADPDNMLKVFHTMVEDSSLDEVTRKLARVAIEELEKPLENVGPKG